METETTGKKIPYMRYVQIVTGTEITSQSNTGQ